MKTFAGAFLACQLVLGIAAPLAFAARVISAECCPGVAPGQTCPMHHSREQSRTCRMTNACASGTAFAPLLGVIGIPVPAAEVAVTATAARSVPLANRSILPLAFAPDLPPPRA